MSDIRKAKISAGANGSGSIEVDGMAVGNLTRGFTLHGGVHEIPTLTLDLILRRGVDVDADAVVRVDGATHALLLDLGWTPPDSALATS